MAWTYATTKQTELRNLPLAEKYALKAVELTKGNHAEYLDTLAEVYIKKGDRDRALETFRKAIALAPPRDVPNYQQHMKQYFADEKL